MTSSYYAKLSADNLGPRKSTHQLQLMYANIVKVVALESKLLLIFKTAEQRVDGVEEEDESATHCWSTDS